MGYFIPASSLANLRRYKYQSEDRSLLSNYVLRPYWQLVAKIFPMWMAPNVVTLIGLLFIVINVMTVLIYDPDLLGAGPRWTYFTYAVGLFLYQTFDACDGAHARRTGQSGPLGELFDHCIDSLNSTLSLIPVSSACGLGYSHTLVAIQLAVLCNFYLSTWEEYHTHKLFLSVFSGPVEGILVVCASFVVVSILGPDIVWKQPILTIAGHPVNALHGMYIFTFGGIFFNVYCASGNVIQYYRKNQKNDSECQVKINEALRGLIPFVLYSMSILALTFVEPDFISLSNLLSIGLSFAFVVGRIIVAHLTMQHFPIWNLPMFIPVAQLGLYFASYLIGWNLTQTAKTLSAVGFGLALGLHGMFVNEIIYEFTTYLDMYALSIKHSKKV